MRIGEFARLAGVNPQTIRFYERKHILRAPLRTPSGYRSYSEQQVETIAFIKQCQQLGFTLQETRLLLDLHREMTALPMRGAGSSQKVADFQRIACDHLASIDNKIAVLQQMRAQLATLLKGFECWRSHREGK